MEVEITNLKEIQAKLEAVARKIRDDENNPVARAGLLIERQAKINASGRPGPKVQTDRLRSSIVTEMSADHQSATVGANVEYAPYVEFGHAQEVGRFIPIQGFTRLKESVLINGKRKTAYAAIGGFRLVNPFAPAYPFLYPAVEQVQANGDLDGMFATWATELEAEWGGTG
jgi:HK97 gp10 family phage protein